MARLQLLTRISAATTVAAAAFFIAGCSSTVRHEIVTTFIDGYPRLPPEEELCRAYVAEAEARKGGKGSEEKGPPRQKSAHPPYTEKRCDSCHNKEAEGGLIKPRDELCGICHTDFVTGSYVHGPVSVGDCLACHLPHTSTATSLLKMERKEICVSCHREGRAKKALHDRAAAANLACPDCHDPHSGDAPFFLK